MVSFFTVDGLVYEAVTHSIAREVGGGYVCSYLSLSLSLSLCCKHNTVGDNISLTAYLAQRVGVYVCVCVSLLLLHGRTTSLVGNNFCHKRAAIKTAWFVCGRPIDLTRPQL